MSFYESHRRRPIYYSGPPRNSSLSTKVKRFAFKACLRCMGGDISAVVPSASRLPRTSPCLVNVSSRAVRWKTPAFQMNGSAELHPHHWYYIKAVWRLSPFPLRVNVKRLQLVMPLNPHRGRMIDREQGVCRPKVSFNPIDRLFPVKWYFIESFSIFYH